MGSMARLHSPTSRLILRLRPRSVSPSPPPSLPIPPLTRYDYRQYDQQAGQNIAGGLSANNISGCITDLWYNAEVSYFYYQYGQPWPDMTYFEQYSHMTQIVWKGTLYFGCATQYCPYGLANAGSVEPYYTVCNYKDPGEL